MICLPCPSHNNYRWLRKLIILELRSSSPSSISKRINVPHWRNFIKKKRRLFGVAKRVRDRKDGARATKIQAITWQPPSGARKPDKSD